MIKGVYRIMDLWHVSDHTIILQILYNACSLIILNLQVFLPIFRHLFLSTIVDKKITESPNESSPTRAEEPRSK